jgi:hypothetical protein
MVGGIVVWEISTWQTNKLPSLIDKCCNILFFDVYDPSVYKRFFVYMMWWHFVIVYMHCLLNSYGMELKFLFVISVLHTMLTRTPISPQTQTKQLKTFISNQKDCSPTKRNLNPKPCDNKQITHKCLMLHLGPNLFKCTKILSHVTLFNIFCPIFFTM